MGERKSSKKDPIAHAQKLLKQCINSPEELRDEVSCGGAVQYACRASFSIGTLTSSAAPVRVRFDIILSHMRHLFLWIAHK